MPGFCHRVYTVNPSAGWTPESRELHRRTRWIHSAVQVEPQHSSVLPLMLANVERPGYWLQFWTLRGSESASLDVVG